MGYPGADELQDVEANVQSAPHGDLQHTEGLVVEDRLPPLLAPARGMSPLLQPGEILPCLTERLPEVVVVLPQPLHSVAQGARDRDASFLHEIVTQRPE